MRSFELARVSALVTFAALGGCVVVTDFGRYGRDVADAGTSDAMMLADGATASDGGTSDGSMARGDASTNTCSGVECEEGTECCDGRCVDVGSDLEHCGACDAACPGGDHASRSCVASECELTCEDGFADCTAAAGCETDLSSVASCGGCGVACATGEVCALMGSTYQCASSCPAGTTACGSSCVDVRSSLAHCGACDAACPARANASAMCTGGECSYACDGAFEDCNGDLSSASSNGCEAVPSLFFPDADGDGFGIATSSMRACAMPTGYASRSGDCDDTNAGRNPGESELCNDVDDDCDGQRDESFADSMGNALGEACSCEPGARVAVVACTSATAASCPYPAETCNGRDDDCDGADDDGFACVQGATGTCTYAGPACSIAGTRSCSGSCAWSACEPPAESCGGGDDNCNGFADEGLFGTLGSRTMVADYATAHSIYPYGMVTGWSPTRREIGVFWADQTGAMEWQWTFVRLDSSGRPLSTPQRVRRVTTSPMEWNGGWDGSAWTLLLVENDRALRFVRVDPAGAVTEGTLGGSSGSSGLAWVNAQPTSTGLFVMWSRIYGGDSRSVFAMHLNGSRAGTPISVLSTGSETPDRPDAIILPSGEAHVFVGLRGATDSVGRIAHRRVRTDGTLGTLAYLDPTPNWEANLRAGYDAASGRAMIVYSVLGTPTGGVYGGAIYDPALGTFSTVPVSGDGYAVMPDGAGNFVVDWAGRRYRATDGAALPEPEGTSHPGLVRTPEGPTPFVRVYAEGAGLIWAQPYGCGAR